VRQTALLADDRVAAIEQLHAATALYTVDEIVRGLFARVSWPRPGARLLDPSVGDGAFLAVAVELLLAAEPGLAPAELVRRIRGWEIHAGACEAAWRRVGAVLERFGFDPALARTLVVHDDFLTSGPGDERFELVATNPPYLRFANVPLLLRAEYERVIADWARNDLLHSFLARCAEALTDDGDMALVAADRFLFNSSCARLRAVLGETLGVAHLSRLDASTAFYRPKERRRRSAPRIHPVEVVLSTKALARLSATPLYPDAAPECAGVALESISTVRIAPWVGPPGVFVVHGDVAERIDGADLVPAIDTDDLQPDGSVRAPWRCVIRTEAAIEPPPAVRTHLERTRHRMPERARLRKDAWWLPPERIDTLDRSAPVIVIPRIATDLKAYVVPAGVLPINHNLTIVSPCGVDLEVLRRAITADAPRAWVRARAPRLENGYLSITTTLLRQLPVELD